MENAELAIDVKHLNKNFGNIKAVVDLSLQVKRGEIFGFLGANGSGKTTTIRMLCGLLVPDSGEGHCLGFDIVKQSALIKLNVGYMTQRFSLYDDLTIEENLDFIARIYQIPDREDQVQESLAELGLLGKQHQLAGTLSGGWKQRLALAAALLHNPKLLLLDEPTAGVDPKARRIFWDQIHYLSSKGITTLVSTHYMDEAERCHRLAYIAYGNLLIQGTSSEIVAATHLVTWAVTGENIISLTEKLKYTPGVEQVTAFGSTLRVSGHDDQNLARNLAIYQSDPNYHWQKVQTTLEDVFISLTERSKEMSHVF